MRIVEILQYTLKPGTGKEFHQVMVEISVPLHHEAGIDVVAFGCSLHDEDSYYLLRAFDDIEHMKASQEAFYGSKAAEGTSNGNHRTDQNQRESSHDPT